jgi:hypothetical protein
MKPIPFLFSFLFATLLSAPLFATTTPNTLTPEEQAGGWQLLFDGKSLDGWKASEQPGTFSVQDGNIVTAGPRSHLYYDGPVQNHDFKNFELRAEVMTYPNANSGIYFHTEFQQTGWPAKGYEVQVNNSHSDWRRTAGLYMVQDNKIPPAPDNTWFTMRIRVEGKHITTWVNEKVISDYTEEPNPVRPADMTGRLLSRGTFALQGHDPKSRVLYHTIAVKVLP